MKELEQLFANNRAWAEEIQSRDPDFFERLAQQQTPNYLWIGCSDSRVPATQILGLGPGDLFVHRNVANVVAHTDLNNLSVLQFAVEALQVRHIILCGHYRCGGVKGALANQELGLIDNWLRHVQAVAQKHRASLSRIDDPDSRLARLCEFNAIEQALSIAHSTVVQAAWARKQPLAIHSWIYNLQDGLLTDLGMDMTGPGEIEASYEAALAALDA